MQKSKRYYLYKVAMSLLVLLACSLPVQVLSQELKLITGTVVEAPGNDPVPGASVKVKGTNKGVVTDVNGRFTIQATSNDVLQFSFLGLQTREVAVKGQTAINVTLEKAESLLKEVVIGYQAVRKEDLTGSVGQVNVDDLNKAPVSNFSDALAGRVAGVQVSSNEGQPGATPNIIIRGASSINNSTEPLYVIDGFPTENTESASLNPDDIESINVLKDAAATAVYGSRASNGVIIIQTKRGKKGKPVITFNSSYGSQVIANPIELMDPYEFVKYQFERAPTTLEGAGANYLSNGRTLDSYREMEGINWSDEVSRTGTILRNNLAIRGGTDQTSYSISGAAFNQDGVLLNTGYDRYQGRVTLDQKISEKFKVGLTAEYMDVSAFGTQASRNPVNTVSSALWFRAWAYRPIGGALTTYDIGEADADPESITTSDIRLNPRSTAENEYLFNTNSNFTANAYLNYSINKDLVLKVTGIRNVLKLNEDRFYNSKTAAGNPLNPLNSNGIWGSVRETDVNIWTNENTLTYTKSFLQTHSLSVIAGNSQTSSKTRANGFTSTNLPEESQGMAGLNEGTSVNPVATSTSWNLSSFFGIVDYNYKSKYYVRGSVRADGSSKFSDRWGYFPAGGVAWNMHKEEFMKSFPFISNSKISVSHGITGNNRIGDFDYYAKLTLDQGAGYSYNNAPNLGAYVSNVQNRNLKWERTIATDIGYDIGLFKNRIELTVEWYKRVTKDLLITNARMSAHTGFDVATQNIGSISNTGFEVNLNTINLKSGSFSWESNFNISFNKNKLLALARDQRNLVTSTGFDVSFPAMYISELGLPLGNMYGYVWDGNYQYADFDSPSPGTYILKPSVTNSGAATILPGDIKYRDLNGDGVITDQDRTIIGRGQPIHYGGFSNNFGYKGFSLNLFFQWSYGNDLYNANRVILEGNANGRTDMNQFASYVDRWSPENQDSKNYRSGGHGQVGRHSSRVVEDGSYLRLKTFSLGYAVPPRYIKRLYLNNLSLNVSAQNLITWTNYTGMDPEVSTRNTTSGVLSPGFDFSPYPQSRTVVFGLNATF